MTQRREDMGKLALEVQIPADDQSDKSLQATEEEKGHFRVCRSCWDKPATNQIVKKSWSGQTGRLSWATDPVSGPVWMIKDNYLRGIPQPALKITNIILIITITIY